MKVLNLRRAQRAVIGAGPGPEGNVTKLVLAEHGHDRARLQADLVGAATAFLDGEDALAGFAQLATGPCRSPAARPRSPATRSPSAFSGCPGTR